MGAGLNVDTIVYWWCLSLSVWYMFNLHLYIYIYIFIFCSIYIQYIASFKASLATLPKVVGQKTRVQGDTLISHVENLTLHLYSNALYIGLIWCIFTGVYIYICVCFCVCWYCILWDPLWITKPLSIVMDTLLLLWFYAGGCHRTVELWKLFWVTLQDGGWTLQRGSSRKDQRSPRGRFLG